MDLICLSHPAKLEAPMRRILLVIALFFAVPDMSAYSQAPLPQGGQPGQQQRQGVNQGGQPGQQQRQGANQAGRPAFSNNQGNPAQGGGDPAYMQQVSYGIG